MVKNDIYFCKYHKKSRSVIERLSSIIKLILPGYRQKNDIPKKYMNYWIQF